MYASPAFAASPLRTTPYGRVVLVGQDNTVSDKTILVRAVWSDIKPNSHQYEESYSKDGGTTWVRSFIANLTRVKQ